MRVTHVITRLIIGGAQENTVASVLGLLHKPGLTPHLISGPASGPEGSLESEFTPYPGLLTTLPHLTRPIHPLKDCLALNQLTRLFLASRPHIVHTHSGKAGLLGRLAARRARIPIIIHTIHGPSFGPFLRPLPNALFRAAERFASQHTTHFISVAHAMTRQYLQAGIGRPDQFTRIFSGFPLAPFLTAAQNPATRAQYNLLPNHFVVGKIARLTELKGHSDLCRAAQRLVARCPHIRFLLVGDGPWRQRLQNQIRSLNLQDHFRLTGLVAPDQIPSLLNAMDAVVHLSCREGLPRALPQALAAGRPVVAYDSDGANEVVLNQQTGFLLPLGDWPQLADKLLQLAGDPLLRQQLASQGRELVRSQFSVEQMVDQIHHLYQRLANTSSFTPPLSTQPHHTPAQ